MEAHVATTHGGFFTSPIRSKTVNFYVLILSMITLWITASTIYMVLPIYFKQAGLSESDIGLLIGLGTLPGAFSALIVGWLSDHIGRRPLLLLGLFLYSACFLLFYFFVGFGFFALTRFIEGVSFYSIPAVATAIIVDIIPPEKRGQAMGLYNGVGSIGRVAGPLISGVILTMASFSNYFIFCSLSVFISALIALIFVQESLPKKIKFAQNGGTPRLQSAGLRSPPIKAGRPLLLFYGSTFVRSLGQTAPMALISLFFTQRLGGISWMEMSILYSVPSLITMVISPFAGRLSDKIGRKKPFIATALCYSVVPLLYIQCYSFVQAAMIRLVEGMAMGFSMPIAGAYLADLLTATGQSGRSGAGFGIFQFLATETSTMGAIYGGYIAKAFGFNELFEIASAMMFAGLLLLVKVPEPRTINQKSQTKETAIFEKT